jgi:hypothetical protein
VGGGGDSAARNALKGAFGEYSRPAVCLFLAMPKR